MSLYGRNIQYAFDIENKYRYIKHDTVPRSMLKRRIFLWLKREEHVLQIKIFVAHSGNTQTFNFSHKFYI